MPRDFNVVSLERFLPRPVRKRGEVNVADVPSFAAYVGAHKGAGTMVFASTSNPQIKAVLDHHEPAKDDAALAPGFGEHVCKLVLQHSPEWLAWTAASGKQMNQTDFAFFLDDHLPDIVEPDGIDVQEVVQNLESRRNVRFESRVELVSGARQFTYADQAETGAMRIPAQFILALCPFVGRQAVRLTARFRYRIKEGTLSVWYDLLRPQQVLEEVFEDVLTEVQAATSLPILRGWMERGALPS